MRKTISIILTIVILIPTLIFTSTAASTRRVEVSDELLKAINEHDKLNEFSKSEVYLDYNIKISDDKFIVLYTLYGHNYPSAFDDIIVGKYRLVVPSIPFPEIFANGELYSMTDAYELGIINDADLETINGFEEVYLFHSGDVDKDDELTILDATAIQMHKADTISLDVFSRMVADYDEDGWVSIMDATAIQMHLAGLDVEA